MKRKTFLKLFIIIILGLVILLAPDKVKAEAKINATEITLYSYDKEELKNKYNVTVPDGLPNQYQLEVTGTSIVPEYSSDGNYVYVDKNGLITVSKNYASENAEIDVRLANEHIKVKVTLISYAKQYVEGILDKYIAENISSKKLSQREQLEEICKYVVTYKYSTEASSYVSYILNGGGDCIASAECVIKMAEKLGMRGKLRYDAYERGAGNNHHNAVIEADGEVYVVETGYKDDNNPRHYLISKTYQGISLVLLNETTGRDGEYVKKYEGFDETINVAEKLKGFDSNYNNFTILDEYFFANCNPKEIILPDGLTTIEDKALYGRDNLTKINIPKTVTKIGSSVFSECNNLKTITVDKGNNNFVFEDGILYDKNKTEIICCLPTKKGKITIPSTVKKIYPYAFYGCKDIEGIFIPKNVTEIGKCAFKESSVKYLDIEDGSSVKLETGAFSNTNIKYGAKIPKNVEVVDTSLVTLFGSYRTSRFTLYTENGARCFR